MSSKNHFLREDQRRTFEKLLSDPYLVNHPFYSTLYYHQYSIEKAREVIELLEKLRDNLVFIASKIGHEAFDEDIRQIILEQYRQYSLSESEKTINWMLHRMKEHEAGDPTYKAVGKNLEPKPFYEFILKKSIF